MSLFGAGDDYKDIKQGKSITYSEGIRVYLLDKDLCCVIRDGDKSIRFMVSEDFIKDVSKEFIQRKIGKLIYNGYKKLRRAK